VKFIVDNWMLISIAMLSAGMLLWPIVQGAAATGITPALAVQLMNREKATVVDVSEFSEFATGHIVGSKSIPVGELETKLGAAVKNKALPLLLVCQTGARSGRAVGIAKKLGFTQVQTLAGGLAAWRNASLPTEKA